MSTLALGLAASLAALVPSVQHDATIEEAIRDLRSPWPLDRYWAAGSLGSFGRDAGKAVSALLSACEDEEAPVRAAAAESLGEIRVDTKRVAPVLGALLDDEDAYVRRCAAGALGRIGRPALDEIRAALADPARRPEAFVALRVMGRAGLGEVERCLDDPELALEALEGIDLSERDGVRLMIECVRRPALRAKALRRLRDARDEATEKAGVPEELEPDVRTALELTLAPESDACDAERLAGLMSSADACVREAAAWAAGTRRVSSGDLEEALAARLADEQPMVRATAAWALGQPFAPSSQGKFGMFVAPRVYAAAWRVAVELTCKSVWPSSSSDPPPELSGLRQRVEPLLADPEASVRLQALRTLRHAGSDLTRVGPTVVALLSDDDEDVALDASLLLDAAFSRAGALAGALQTAAESSRPERFEVALIAASLAVVVAQDDALERACTMLLADQPGVRAGAASGLTIRFRHAMPDEAFDLLVGAFLRGEAPDCGAALVFYGARALPTYLELLHSEDEEIVGVALLSIGFVDGGSAARKRVSEFESHPNPALRQVAGWTLAALDAAR